MLVATLLSQFNLMGSLKLYPSSLNNIFNHNNSYLCAMAWNLASALDLATIECFYDAS
jgi:hypothetical protein